jgi:hypothetical protein
MEQMDAIKPILDEEFNKTNEIIVRIAESEDHEK